jgi:hypothetical protein
MLILLLFMREQVNRRLIHLVTVKRVAEHYDLETHATELHNITNLDLVALQYYDKRIYLVDETGSVTIEVLDYVPCLHRGMLALFFIVVHSGPMIQPKVLYK